MNTKPVSSYPFLVCFGIPYGWHSVLETACNYQIMASTAYMMAKKFFL